MSIMRHTGALIAVCWFAAASVDGQQPLELSRDVVAVQDAVAAAIQRCEVSVVAVRGTRKAQASYLHAPPNPFGALQPTDPSGDMVETLEASFGTGVILDGSGLILTHYEVIRGLDTIEVMTAERRTYPAQVVGADERSGLAVLSVPASGLPAVALGDATRLRKGEFVIALGNPYAIAADGQASASFGIVANLGRKSTVAPRPEQAALSELGWLIQTDAKLNLGTSGGALVNLQGELVGLTTSLAATAGYDQAAGYAVPVDNAFRRIVESLRAGREVEYGLLGVSLEGVGNRGGILGRGPQGALVREVVPGGPADRAGLKMGDVITQVGEAPVDTSDALMLAVSQQPPLATVEIEYSRNDRDESVRVTLSKAVAHGEQIVTVPAATWRGLQVDFATAVEGYAAAARQGGVDSKGCVAVRHVEPQSPAWKAGLRAGSFISRINEHSVQTPDEFHSIVDAQTGDVVLQIALPQNESQQVTVGQS
jgi:S1-C subfamily serine protease